jgi:hypothetical protein
MSKPWLYYLVAPTQIIGNLRDLAVQLGDGGEAERLNFSVPVCVASDPKTIVAYGGGTGSVGDATVAYLEAIVLPTLPPQVSWVRCVNEAAPPRIVASSDAETQARINAGKVVVWDLGTALADVGLVLYQPLVAQ